jgi:hypothetical protein
MNKSNLNTNYQLSKRTKIIFNSSSISRILFIDNSYIIVQGDSSFTARTINPMKKNSKNYETLGFHSLHIRLQTCAINFPVSLSSWPSNLKN